jgi:hypothetical protein
MTDLDRYHSPPAPLSGGARFIRGFKRIGIVVGIMIFLIGLGFSFIAANDSQQKQMGWYLQAKCTGELPREKIKMASYDKSLIDLRDSGCYGPYSTTTWNEVIFAAARKPAPLEYMWQPFAIGGAISAACALAGFFALWLTGWLFAGFTRD